MSVLLENFHSPLARLLLQFIVIILATRPTGSLFARFGQPPVIGEITAGILLGPSLFGWRWPDDLGILPPRIYTIMVYDFAFFPPPVCPV